MVGMCSLILLCCLVFAAASLAYASGYDFCVSLTLLDVARLAPCSLPSRLPAVIPKGWPYVSPGWSDARISSVAQPWGANWKSSKPQRGGPILPGSCAIRATPLGFGHSSVFPPRVARRSLRDRRSTLG